MYIHRDTIVNDYMYLPTIGLSIASKPHDTTRIMIHTIQQQHVLRYSCHLLNILISINIIVKTGVNYLHNNIYIYKK